MNQEDTAAKAALWERILAVSRANGNMETETERAVLWIEAAIKSAADTAKLFSQLRSPRTE